MTKYLQRDPQEMLRSRRQNAFRIEIAGDCYIVPWASWHLGHQRITDSSLVYILSTIGRRGHRVGRNGGVPTAGQAKDLTSFRVLISTLLKDKRFTSFQFELHRRERGTQTAPACAYGTWQPTWLNGPRRIGAKRLPALHFTKPNGAPCAHDAEKSSNFFTSISIFFSTRSSPLRC